MVFIIRMAEEENKEIDEEQLKEKETVIMEIGKKYVVVRMKMMDLLFIIRKVSRTRQCKGSWQHDQGHKALHQADQQVQVR